jgi:hypothetical protein
MDFGLKQNAECPEGGGRHRPLVLSRRPCLQAGAGWCGQPLAPHPVRIIVQLPNLASAVVYGVTVQLIHTLECAIMRGTEPRQRQPRAHQPVKT